MNWHLQDAKNHFSKVVKLARTEGPQTVTVRGELAAVVVSAEEYDRLKAAAPRKSLAEFLLEEGPVWSDDMAEAVNQRSRDPGRDIDL